MALFPFDNSYARLPERFFRRQPPAIPPDPRLLRLNEALARRLGLDPAALGAPEGVAALAGASVPEGAAPLAQLYAGHQFGGWSPQLGDGRAILLGEVIAPDGARFDIQLKGAGRTPFSRSGDGRAVLGPVLREYILGEAMAALGIPTTRGLAALTTGETVLRTGPEAGAILVRVAASHVRVGTFQALAVRDDTDGLAALLAHAAARHGLPADPGGFLDGVIARQADLIARWMGVGFIHGVMNTDNMTVSGETIDYGPCAFLDAYHPGMVFSSIDHAGRYAYGNQPGIGQWNLARLAQSLLPLLNPDPDAALARAQAAIDRYPALYQTAWGTVFARKLGMADPAMAAPLAEDLLARMAAGRADFTRTFRALADAAEGNAAPARAQFDDPALFDEWALEWAAAGARCGVPDPGASIRAASPARIPRNHRVEAALSAAQAGDLGPFEALLTALAAPFDDDPALAAYGDPPRPGEEVRETFCGT